MSFKNYTNEVTDLIDDYFGKHPHGILGIIVTRNSDFNVAGFDNYIEEHARKLGDMDIRGPFAENFEPTNNGAPEKNIFYMARGNIIQYKCHEYLQANPGEVGCMFREIFKGVPVYMIGKKYVLVEDRTIHDKLRDVDGDNWVHPD